MSDLLPCPHCGGEAYIRRTIVNDDTMRVVDHDAMYTVFCGDSEDCGASVAYFTERKQAISAWNRRAEYGDYMIGTDDDDHSDPGEYGRNPVTAEDVLRSAAQMRAEVEALEAKYKKGVMTVEEYRRVVDNPPWLLQMRAKTVENPPLDTKEGS